ncbi:endonuclease/exonuclease/phosphatase family protein [Bifidobacterium subtile]|uniref:Endonuclease n=1 Tax=Bifidobacterium subtile TaxID=77635 RepID=A0A087EBZ7_9BIFI|nr:endonuclease/exonuclease/phosphatase family protein [Bifidobacterium subtile]KFJ05298.1 endonuclease [Bifidobacterium subtile]QOL36687.1 endonuclease/exonuclease/phosphatase family protein [Bifidobacterium subtile]
MISWLLSAALLIVAVWVSLCFLPSGGEAHGVLPYLIALVPFAWIPAATIAAYALLARQWWVAVAGAAIAMLVIAIERHAYRCTPATATENNAAAAGTGVTAASDGTPATPATTAEAGQGTKLQVMTLNCRYGRADAQAIVEAVRSKDIAVLALQEMSRDLLQHLGEAGLGRLLPHHQIGTIRDTDNGGFNGIWTNLRVIDATADTIDIPAAAVPSLIVAVPQQTVSERDHDVVGSLDSTGSAPADSSAPNPTALTSPTTSEASQARTILFASAHPKSPMRGSAQWSQGIIGLAGVNDAVAHDNGAARPGSTVVMGDLNSNLHHPSFRALLRSGMHDASLRQGSGRRITTFPTQLRWPRLELDHILFSAGLESSGTESFVIPGSDHLALAATLTVA